MLRIVLIPILSILSNLHTSSSLTAEVSTSCAPRVWQPLNVEYFTCEIRHQKISSENVIISSARNTSVKGFLISNVKLVEFIPKNVVLNYPNLEVFRVLNCSIGFIEETIFAELPNLTYLDLAGNNIKIIERNVFKNQRKLEILDLAENQIEFISSQLFSSLVSLKTLELYKNKIEWISDDHFVGLVNLESINLNSNDIKMLYWEAFSELSNLNNIYINYNNIEEVRFNSNNQNSNTTNEKLEKINLYGNKIVSMDLEIFMGKKMLKYLDLRNNTCVNRSYTDMEVPEIIKDLESHFSSDKCVQAKYHHLNSYEEGLSASSNAIIINKKIIPVSTILVAICKFILS